MTTEEWIVVGESFISKDDNLITHYFNGLYIKALYELDKDIPMLKIERTIFKLIILSKIYSILMQNSKMKNTAITWRED